MSDFAEINAIVKHRYETGEYGHTHFKVSPDVLDEVRATATPAPEPQPYPWMPSYNPLVAMLAIPVVPDDTLPPGTWRLVDNSTDEILRESEVPDA